MILDEVNRLNLPFDKKTLKLKSISFHPVQSQRKLAIAFRKDIYEYDIVTGARLNHFTVDSEVTHLAHGYSHNVLCAASRNGSFHVWDLSSGRLESFHSPTRSSERRSVVCMQASHKRPTLFYSKVKFNVVCALPMFSNSQNAGGDYAHKKQISSLAAHPNKDMLATASIDGQIKIWNTETQQTHIVFDESGSSRMIKREPVTAMAFYPTSVHIDQVSTSLLTAQNMPPVTSRSSRRDTISGNSIGGKGVYTELLVTGTQNGRIQIWQLIPSIGYAKSLATINMDDRIWITSVHFHPMLPCLMALNAKGCMRFISTGTVVSNFLQGKITDNPHAMMGLLQPFDLINTFYASTHDASSSLSNLRYQSYLVPLIQSAMDEKTGDVAFFGKISSLCPSTHPDSLMTNYFSVYNIVDPKHPQSVLPLCQQFHWSLSLFTQKKPSEQDSREYESKDMMLPYFEFPLKDVLYMDTNSALPHCMLMAYPLSASSATAAVNKQLIKAGQSFEDFRRCIRARFPSCTFVEDNPASLRADSMLLFFERPKQSLLSMSSSQQGESVGTFQYIHVNVKNKECSHLLHGMDGGFINDHVHQAQSSTSGIQYVILDEFGSSLSLVIDTEIKESITLKDRIGRVFTSDIGPQIIYFHMDESILGYACPLGRPDRLQFDHHSPVFHLRRYEQPLEIYWQSDHLCREDCLIAVLTSERICILNTQLQQLASVESPRSEIMYFRSCIWVGNVLLYNTPSNLYCLTPYIDYQSGGVWNPENMDDDHSDQMHHICTLDVPNSVLCGALADRVVFACQTHKKPEIYSRYISLAEPLTLGVLAIPNDKISNSEKLQLLKTITARFNCASFSQKALLRLEQHGFADLASALVSKGQYTPPWDIRFRLAKSALQFSTAFDILKNQFLDDQAVSIADGAEHSLVSENSGYMPLFVDLAHICIDYGQYDLALKCLDIINDVWLMLRIFSTASNTKGLQLLAQRCAQWPEHYGVYLACQSLLQATGETESMSVTPDSARQINRMDVELHDVPKYTIRTSTVDDDRSYDLCIGGAKGTIHLKNMNENGADGSNEDDPNASAPPSLDRPGNEMTMMNLSDLAKWMGFVDGTTGFGTVDQREQDWDRVEFNQDDFGANKDLQSTRSDAGISDDETTATEGMTQDEIRKMYQINEEELDPRFEKMRRVKVDMTKNYSEKRAANLSFQPPPASSSTGSNRRIGSTKKPHTIPPLNLPSDKKSDNGTEGSDTTSARADTDDARTEIDEDGYTVRHDIDAIRRQYMGGSSDEDDDGNDDGHENSAKNKRRLFRKIKISSEAIHQEVDSSSLSKATIGLSVGGIAAPPSSSRRRRVIGLTSAASTSSLKSGTSVGDDDSTHSYPSLSPSPSPSPSSTSSSAAGFRVRALVPSHKPTQQINPAETLKQGMLLMEKGKFNEARKAVHDSTTVLVSDATQVLKKQNIMLCVRYKLLITMLMRVRTMEQQYQQQKSPELLQDIASLTVFLNTISYVLPKHRITCKNMAIKRNMMAGNFGLAAGMLLQLLPETPEQFREAMQDRLKICQEDNEGRNSNTQLANLIPPSGPIDDCVMFCWFKFTPIHTTRESYLECTYCNAHYSYDEEEIERQKLILGEAQIGNSAGKPPQRLSAVAMSGTKCPHCMYGDIELKAPHIY